MSTEECDVYTPNPLRAEIVPQSLGDALGEIFNLRDALYTERTAHAETKALLQQAVRQTTALTEKAAAEQDRAEAAVRTMAADFLQSKGKVETLRAAKERAEELYRRESTLNDHLSTRIGELTAALADAREAALEQCEMIAFEQHEYEVADAIRALRALPTTEPAKAEEP